LEVAQIRVLTTRRGFINEVMNIKVVGAVFKLWVVEEGGPRWSSRVVEEDVWNEVHSSESREGEVEGARWKGSLMEMT
jgi:hypothetical protein